MERVDCVRRRELAADEAQSDVRSIRTETYWLCLQQLALVMTCILRVSS